MWRSRQITRYLPKGGRGIEVAPFHSPVLTPDLGYEVVTLDVFDQPTLIARANADPLLGPKMAARIGPVDLVGSACDIAELAQARYGQDARFDFIVSSHNFEHLPDPIRFVQGCEALLRPGGVLSMAVPDKRACYDYFRPHTATTDLLEAFHEGRVRPSLAQVFNREAYAALYRHRGQSEISFDLAVNPAGAALEGDLRSSYSLWVERRNSGSTEYIDTHCWTFTPAVFELIVVELIVLGLTNLEIASVSKAAGCEFFVHLRKRMPGSPPEQSLIARREELLFRVIDELAYASPYAWKLRRGLAPPIVVSLMAAVSTFGGRVVRAVKRRLPGEATAN